MNLPSHDQFQGILAFVRAVECGSFSLASRQLGLSPSSVGKAVARLEQRLGTRLFQRTTRRLSLTDEGAAFHASCLRVLAELARAENLLADQRDEPTGRLRIALPTLYGQTMVLPVLLELAERHPGLDFDLQFSHRKADLVSERFDLAVRIGALDDSASHVARPLGSQQLVLCAAPAHLARYGSPSTLAALHQHPRITRLLGEGDEAWQLQDHSSTWRAWPQAARLRLSELPAIKTAALAGLGIAQIPSWFVAQELQTGQLVSLLPEQQPAPLPIHLLWPHTTQMTSRLRLVIDGLLAQLKDARLRPVRS